MNTKLDFKQLLSDLRILGIEALAMQRPGPGGIPERPLGRTGEWVSLIGLGGYDSVVNKSDAEGVDFILEALDLGITFWDNAWEYHDGRAEEVMGQAIASGGVRDRIFLMTKVCARDYHGFHRQLDDCLRRLRTDQIDLVQLHSIQYPGDRDRFFDPENGAMRAALEAQASGKFRHLGFTGHMDPLDHEAMLGTSYDWATVQFPVNVVDAHLVDGFQSRIFAECRRRNIGMIGMKSLAANDGRIPAELQLNAELCRHYAMSLPISSLVAGIQTREQLHRLVAASRDFKPLSVDALEELLTRTRGVEDILFMEGYKDRTGAFGCTHHAGVYAASLS
ncbi:MAG: aldo/keto reductase [Acidobacteria bacterium]|nr:aldo/keto reductase [Acidobacteriota bacterium]